MKKTIKTLICLILTFCTCLLTVSLIGCGSSANPNNGSTTLNVNYGKKYYSRLDLNEYDTLDQCNYYIFNNDNTCSYNGSDYTNVYNISAINDSMIHLVFKHRLDQNGTITNTTTIAVDFLYLSKDVISTALHSGTSAKYYYVCETYLNANPNFGKAQ